MFCSRSGRQFLSSDIYHPFLHYRPDSLDHYMQKLFNSGYDQQFRTEILLSVIKAFHNILGKHERGEKPLHRDRDFQKEERRRTKNNKIKSWYRKNGQYDSVMFVPLTPGSVLKHRIQERLQGGLLVLLLLQQLCKPNRIAAENDRVLRVILKQVTIDI